MSAHGDVDMGHTVAGWTGTGVAILGSAVAGTGMCLDSAAVLAAGLGVVVLSVLATWALHLTGWGKPSGPRPPAEWDWRVRDSMAGHHSCLGCRMAGRRRPGRVPVSEPKEEPALADA